MILVWSCWGVVESVDDGLPAEGIAGSMAEVGPMWQARQDARQQQRPRRRAVGAGAKYKLVFVRVDGGDDPEAAGLVEVEPTSGQLRPRPDAGR